MPSKPTEKPGTARRRRSVVQVRERGLMDRLREVAEHPRIGWALLLWAGFLLVSSVLTNWTRESPLVAVGQVMSETRTVRVEFTTVDERQTDRKREEARQRTPRIFTADTGAIEEIRASLENLPRTVAGAESIDAVQREIRVAFGLNADKLAALRELSGSETALADWARHAGVLAEILRRRPMLDRATYQAATQEGLSPQIELVVGELRTLVGRNEAINSEDPERLAADAAAIARAAGFAGVLGEVAAARLSVQPRATFSFDGATTVRTQDAAAAAVRPEVVKVPVGQKIFDRGDVLSQAQRDLFVRELHEFQQNAPAWRLWIRRLSVAGAVTTLSAVMAGYIAVFCPSIARKTPRAAWLALTLALALGVACIGTASDPRFMVLALLGPLIFVAMLLCIAYDQRTALAVSAFLAVLACLGLAQPIGMYLLCLVGIAAAVATLRDLRDRQTLIRASVLVALVLFGAAWFVGLIDRPVTQTGMRASLMQTLREAVQAAVAGLLAGGVTLFVLPVVEDLFDITTGMTLSELRDPRQPLLREMQQRAPGTYNHSLNVASIAEAAADSIGADSLLTYVGCLYHDIGKINKPEYFVENQAGGPNRHDKLSPAMSLLVIVGHVKDGMEMARDYGLPRSLLHFIEAHHGTTLVEFFYNRAKQQAQAASADAGVKPEDEADRLPDEVDYRYPGPRPRSKEVAILMLTDAVESATRTLPEPTPARIDALVRDLATRRLQDGQFDECDLTLRELRTICDSIAKSVASIYHGRIKYASTAGKPKPAAATTAGGDGPKEKSA